MMPRFDARVSALRLAGVAMAVSLLGGCGKGGDAPVGTSAMPSTAVTPPTGEAPVATRRSSAASSERELTAKMNEYTAAFNRLVGTFGLPETHERYVKENIAHRKPTESLSISDGWIDTALGQFRKARALPGSGLEELDKSGDALIARLDPLVTQLKALQAYYNAKAYKEDNLARGKTEDPHMLASFDASVKAMNDFESVLTREGKKRDEVILARMKASGDMLGYNAKMSLSQAEKVVYLFSGEADLRKPEKYQAGDILVAELEKTLADQHKAYDAAKGGQPSPDSGYESLTSRLESFVGEYRDMKQSKEANDYKDMLKKYNDAVETANQISH